mmetsp:Transcript_20998/g.46051  ORF Transcript_20998/g.46051 Transcript_20998/m.46051 type:complete len:297 (+) Transcript_20998:203-1093(+)
MSVRSAATVGGLGAANLRPQARLSSARARLLTNVSAQSAKGVHLRRYGAKLNTSRVRNVRADRQKGSVTRVRAAAEGSIEDQMAEIRGRRDDPRWWVQARVFDEVEVPVSIDRDEGAELNAYMTLPVSQFALVEMPLGGKLERLDEDLFAVYVPRVAVFDFFVEPRLECYVTHETDPVRSVKIVSRSCEVDGSPFVKSLNRCFDFHVETTFTWTSADDEDSFEAPAIVSTSIIDCLFDPPPPLSLLGKSVLEAAANAIFSTTLTSLQRTFIQNVSKDYNRWAKDSQYRTTRQKHFY